MPGKVVTCFAVGSQKLYDYIDDNPTVNFKETAYTNDTAIIRRNPKVVAINSAIEIDLTGQICADTIGAYQYSGDRKSTRLNSSDVAISYAVFCLKKKK